MAKTSNMVRHSDGRRAVILKEKASDRGLLHVGAGAPVTNVERLLARLRDSSPGAAISPDDLLALLQSKQAALTGGSARKVITRTQSERFTIEEDVTPAYAPSYETSESRIGRALRIFIAVFFAVLACISAASGLGMILDGSMAVALSIWAFGAFCGYGSFEFWTWGGV